jgi:Glycosyl hydrolase family 46
MTETLLERASVAALLVLLAACSSSGGGPPPAGGNGGSAAGGSAGTGGSGGGLAGNGGNDGSAGRGGSGAGGAGGPGTGGSGGSAGTGGSGTGGSPGSGGAGTGGSGGRADAGPAPDAGTPGTGPADYQSDTQFCQALGLNCGGDTLADRAGVLHTVYCGTCSGGQSCIGKPSGNGGAAGQCKPLAGLDANQKHKAEALTSVWENNNPQLQYGFSKDIGDMRGFTSGRAGFCTGTGDAIVVIQCYDVAKPNNNMQKYMPELIRIEERFVRSNYQLQGDVSGLTGWVAAWGVAANDPVFNGCQDNVVDAVYYGIALQHADDKKLTTALTKVALWDAEIMHGESDPKISVSTLMAMADSASGPLSSPPTMSDESRWLQNFLTARARMMDLYDEWRGNNYRVATYEKLRRAGNFTLAGCIQTGDVSASTYYPGLSSVTSASFMICDP